MFKRKIVPTEDGSMSVEVPELGQCYHSTHGAINESKHIFIEAALAQHSSKNLNILEFGFGTGLNAYLSWDFGIENNLKIQYHALEKYPLEKHEYQLLNYASSCKNLSRNDFLRLHELSWGTKFTLDQQFNLYKECIDFREVSLPLQTYDIVYFDAFAPDVQPELWSQEILSRIFKSMKINGILTTYSVKGDVKRSLKAAGFFIEKIPGPIGKREILRAIKQ